MGALVWLYIVAAAAFAAGFFLACVLSMSSGIKREDRADEHERHHV